MSSFRHKLYRHAAAVTLLGMTVALPGLSHAEPVRIGAAVYGLQNEYAQIWAKEIEGHPAVQQKIVELTVFDGKYDHLTQRAQFDTMETQRYNGALYVPIDSKACDQVAKRAAASELPVVGSNGPCDTQAYVSYIGSDDVEAGRQVATAVVELVKEGGVVELQGPVGQLGAIQRGQGIGEILAKHPTIKLLESKTANWSRQEAFKIMQDWLVAHPGQIKGVIAQNDEMALGAIRALKAAGIDPKTVPVAGVDGVMDARKAVKSGEMILTVAQDAHAQAQGAFDILLRRVIGADYKPMSDVWTVYGDKMPWNDGAEKSYTVPWTYITAQNVDSYIK